MHGCTGVKERARDPDRSSERQPLYSAGRDVFNRLSPRSLQLLQPLDSVGYDRKLMASAPAGSRGAVSRPGSKLAACRHVYRKSLGLEKGIQELETRVQCDTAPNDEVVCDHPVSLEEDMGRGRYQR